jgi:hypothetical protein
MSTLAQPVKSNVITVKTATDRVKTTDRTTDRVRLVKTDKTMGMATRTVVETATAKLATNFSVT